MSLLSSGTNFIDAELIQYDPKSTSKIFELKQNVNSYTINLSESIGISEFKQQSNNFKKYHVSLHEKLSVTSDHNESSIIVIKHNSERKAMMERIIEKPNKLKLFQANSKLTSSSIINYDQNIVNDELDFTISASSFEKSPLPIYQIINIVKPTNLFYNFETFMLTNENGLTEINFDSIQIFNSDDPIFLILLAPLAGFILIRYDNTQIKFYQIKQFFTFTLIVILVSSAVITPMSVSSSYWGIAYAEEFSFEGIIDDSKNNFNNSTEPIIESNSTSIEPVIVSNTNSTEPIIVSNSTSTDLINATSTEPIIVSNATSTDLINATSTEPIIVSNATSTDLINATSTEPIIVPEATISFQLDESYLMIVVTEEKGTIQNTVNAGIHTTSCEGTTIISNLPENEYEEISLNAPRIFDVNFQIENGTKHRASTDSEFFYVSEQDLEISAIIDSKNPLKRVELRTITLGQADDEYIAIKMNTEDLLVSPTTYVVTATIPSFLMQDPAISYWIHVIDEELAEVESAHYTMGVKPITTPDVSLELDVPSIKQSNSIVRPSLYINNDKSPSYGIVSLIVDDQIVSEKAQFFDNGQTKVSFDWKVPGSQELSSYDIQGKVDLYGISEITDSAILYSHPQTVSASAYDMQTLEIIEKDGDVLSEPVLLYASDSRNDELKFRVTAPNGQCIIGSSDECSVQDSTRGNRGGLQSVQFNDQTLRIKYSGSDSIIERFSITSIDPIVGDWSITLETEEGLIPQAQAVKDLDVKVKHKIHSEINTVYSD
ncbi:MAG: hypothetical protein HOM02_03880 [Thaumarchaeota archaeon]|nr:hypothetical protein [Nitrososphaerota archaeon]